MLEISTTQKDQIIDITEKIEEIISKSNIDKGVITLNILHTTASLSTADLDPGTDLDIQDALRAIIPDLKYRHPHDPTHAPDHILSTLIGTDLTIPFDNKTLILGTWQRIILLEFDGPKVRKIHTTLIGANV